MANTSEEKDLLHTAIASWAGFTYQGLCGVYHALTLIKEDKEAYKDFSISLDTYEDFSILNADGLAVSLHQCKDVKGATDFQNEQLKMNEKFAQYRQKECLADGCKMFFHSATQITCEDGIEAYSYHNGQTYCRPNDILKLIEEIITDILPGDTAISIKEAKLAAMVDAQVLYAHGVMHNTDELQKIVALREANIHFRDIIHVLFHTIHFSLSEEDFFSFVRSKYFIEWLDRMSDEEDEDLEVNIEKMEQYMSHLMEYDSLKGNDLLIRISPYEKVAYSHDSLVRLFSPEKANTLFKVLHDVDQPLNDCSFDWFVGDQRLTPTTIRTQDQREMKLVCRQIIENRANLDCLREYDALVGSVHHSIPSISSETKLFNRLVEEGDEIARNSIFSEKNIGIKSIGDMNAMS